MNRFLYSTQNLFLDHLADYVKTFFAYHGVHYVDVGYKFIKNKLIPKLAIRVHVHRKLPPHRLSSSQQLPKMLGNIPIDVIESHPSLDRHSVNQRNIRFDPLVGGIAIQNSRYNTLGTLGCVLYDPISQGPVGLSNYHVLVGDSGRKGDQITQPGTKDPQDIIGKVTRWHQELDCAIFSINDSRKTRPAIVGLTPSISGILEPLIGMSVIKSGLTTGVTQGMIDGVSLDEFTIIPKRADPSIPYEISAPGDSGSIWLEKTSGKAVGLHYAGERDPDPIAERAWAKKMTKICAALQVNVLS